MPPNQDNDNVADVFNKLLTKDEGKIKDPGPGKVIARDGTEVTLNEDQMRYGKF